MDHDRPRCFRIFVLFCLMCFTFLRNLFCKFMDWLRWLRTWFGTGVRRLYRRMCRLIGYRQYNGSHRRLRDEGSWEELESKYYQALAQKEEALRRLSEVMSIQLRDNNPNIVDLSDEFRPEKLKEISNELSDNEWTAAFSSLDSGDEEEQIIELLLNVLMEAYTFCKLTYNNEWQGLVQSICGIEGEASLTSYEAKQLKDMKKKYALKCTEVVQKTALAHLKSLSLCGSSYYENESFNSYIQECARLGWLMQLQDPPVVFRCYGWTSKAIPEGMTTEFPHSSKKRPSGNSPSVKFGSIQDGATGPKQRKIKSGAQDGGQQGEPGHRQFETDSVTVESETCNQNDKIKFDKGLYREYTKSGPYIGFVVWPVMYLYEHGPVLSKGVAQGCSF